LNALLEAPTVVFAVAEAFTEPIDIIATADTE